MISCFFIYSAFHNWYKTISMRYYLLHVCTILIIFLEYKCQANNFLSHIKDNLQIEHFQNSKHFTQKPVQKSVLPWDNIEIHCNAFHEIRKCTIVNEPNSHEDYLPFHIISESWRYAIKILHVLVDPDAISPPKFKKCSILTREIRKQSPENCLIDCNVKGIVVQLWPLEGFMYIWNGRIIGSIPKIKI